MELAELFVRVMWIFGGASVAVAGFVFFYASYKEAAGV
jgi:hypothetical protein